MPILSLRVAARLDADAPPLRHRAVNGRPYRCRCPVSPRRAPTPSPFAHHAGERIRLARSAPCSAPRLAPRRPPRRVRAAARAHRPCTPPLHLPYGRWRRVMAAVSALHSPSLAPRHHRASKDAAGLSRRPRWVAAPATVAPEARGANGLLQGGRQTSDGKRSSGRGGRCSCCAGSKRARNGEKQKKGREGGQGHTEGNLGALGRRAVGVHAQGSFLHPLYASFTLSESPHSSEPIPFADGMPRRPSSP